jgi:hypothetical protein
VTTAAAAPAVPWALQVVGRSDPWQQALGGAIAGIYGSVQALIAALPLPEPVRNLLSGATYSVRQALFNQAPTVRPLQLTGLADTAVTGHVDAVDPEGDRITYRLVKGPTSGTLTLNSDGSFTYTPDADFSGVASFVVMAQDLGQHVNLLEPLRAAGTSAGALINEGAIKFAFTYTAGSEFWSPDARNALLAAANAAATYFLVSQPVTLDYEIQGENAPASPTLASAFSPLISEAPGYWRTVVQNKLISGVDSNGAAADGEIEWNWGSNWGLGDTVSTDEFDFVSTAVHELVHSFGFLSFVGAPGTNANLGRPLFDSFVENSTSKKPIKSNYIWNTAYDPNLIGGKGGLYFGGANAVAAYGALVPLFTPDPWTSGSSMSHLDDATFTGSNQKMMNARTDTGLGVRVLSPIELGILKDLGYTVMIPSVAV